MLESKQGGSPRARIALGSAAAVTLAFTGPAEAQTIRWVGGDGNWSIAANWEGGNVPDAPGESALIDVDADVTADLPLTLDAITQTHPDSRLYLTEDLVLAAQGLAVGGRAFVAERIAIDGPIRIETGGSLSVQADAQVALSAAEIVIDGELSADRAPHQSYSLLVPDGFTIRGQGQLRLGNIQARLWTGLAARGTLINEGTIRGRGEIRAHVTNRGLIDANRFTELEIDGALINENDALATGGQLRVAGGLTQTQGSIVDVQAGSAWISGDITGGAIVTAPGAEVTLNGEITGEVRLGGAIEASYSLGGVVVRDADVISEGVLSGSISIEGDVSLTGVGTTTADLALRSGASLVIGEAHAVETLSVSGAAGALLDNRGVVRASDRSFSAPGISSLMVRNAGRIEAGATRLILSDVTIEQEPTGVLASPTVSGRLVLAGATSVIGGRVEALNQPITVEAGSGEAAFDGCTIEGHVSALGGTARYIECANRGLLDGESPGRVVIEGQTHNDGEIWPNALGEGASFNGTGVVWIGSPVTVAGAAPVVNPPGHTFTGVAGGRLAGDLVNAGILRDPAFTVDGDATLQAQGTVRLSGAWPHATRILHVDNRCDVDGDLILESAEPGTYVVLWAPVVTGVFADLSIPAGGEPRRVRQMLGPFENETGLFVHVQRLCHCDTSTGLYTLDIFDFLCFQDEFLTGEPIACNCDVNTGQGVCDIFDFLCFQDAFAAGCE